MNHKPSEEERKRYLVKSQKLGAEWAENSKKIEREFPSPVAAPSVKVKAKVRSTPKPGWMSNRPDVVPIPAKEKPVVAKPVVKKADTPKPAAKKAETSKPKAKKR